MASLPYFGLHRQSSTAKVKTEANCCQLLACKAQRGRDEEAWASWTLVLLQPHTRGELVGRIMKRACLACLVHLFGWRSNERARPSPTISSSPGPAPSATPPMNPAMMQGGGTAAYRALGVAPDATASQIKRAYRACMLPTPHLTRAPAPSERSGSKKIRGGAVRRQARATLPP